LAAGKRQIFQFIWRRLIQHASNADENLSRHTGNDLNSELKLAGNRGKKEKGKCIPLKPLRQKLI
jgi:hypothetical protein